MNTPRTSTGAALRKGAATRKPRTTAAPEAPAETAPEAAVAVLEPEPPPKWPPIEPQLRARFPDLARPLPDMDAGFTRRLEQMRAASERDRTENRALAADFHAETLGLFDRAHMQVRNGGRRVQGDACAYAEAADLGACPGHEPFDLARVPASRAAAPHQEFDDALAWTPPPPVAAPQQHHETTSPPWLDAFQELAPDSPPESPAPAADEVSDDTGTWALSLWTPKPEASGGEPPAT